MKVFEIFARAGFSQKIKPKKSPPSGGLVGNPKPTQSTNRPFESLVSTSCTKDVSARHSAISSVHVRKHNMARGNAIDFSGERFALLTFFNKKGNKTTLETIYYIL